MKKKIPILTMLVLIICLTGCGGAFKVLTMKTSVGNYTIKMSGAEVREVANKDDGTGYYITDSDGSCVVDATYYIPDSVNVPSNYQLEEINGTQYIVFQTSPENIVYCTHLGIYGSDVGIAFQTSDSSEINYITLSGTSLKGADSDPTTYFTNIISVEDTTSSSDHSEDHEPQSTIIDDTSDSEISDATDESYDTPSPEEEDTFLSSATITLSGLPFTLYAQPDWEMDVTDNEIGVIAGDNDELLVRYRDSEVSVGDAAYATEWLSALECTEYNTITICEKEGYIGYGTDEYGEFYIVLQDIGATNYLEIVVLKDSAISKEELTRFLISL